MKFYVGTSGWSYSWNPDGFKWYSENSKLNAVELNSSFYRFPLKSYIKSWVKYGSELKWSVKVHRLVTHVFKMSSLSFKVWKKFKRLFEPLEKSISFYLFQLPPSFSEKHFDRIEKFAKKAELENKFALEVRNDSLFTKEIYKRAKEAEITFVSVDAPKFTRDIIKTSPYVYLRMHGRSSWYSHNYSKKELEEVAEKIKAKKSRAAFVFFNNDHNMLKNARKMLSLLNK